MTVILLKNVGAFAALALTVFAAQAQNAPLTREQVRAEFFSAQAQDRLPRFGEVGNWPEPASSVSALTRAEVLNDLRINGPYPSGEGSSVNLHQSRGTMTSRAAVKAQAIVAMRLGTIVSGEK